MKPMCRHCQKTKSNRPRGLCWTCYYTPGVRDLYPSTSKFARRGEGNFNGNAPLPEEPTDAPPGSEAKILILMERARKKQSLFHPDDSILARPEFDIEQLAEAFAPDLDDEPVELRNAG